LLVLVLMTVTGLGVRASAALSGLLEPGVVRPATGPAGCGPDNRKGTPEAPQSSVNDLTAPGIPILRFIGLRPCRPRAGPLPPRLAKALGVDRAELYETPDV
jgi:hypothetical protein